MKRWRWTLLFVLILGVDDLEDTQYIFLGTHQGDGEHGTGDISRCFVEFSTEMITLGGSQLVDVGDAEHFAGGRCIAGDALLVDGHGEGRIDQFLSGRKPFLQGGVLGMGEIQPFALTDIDRAGIGVDKLACPCQHPLQKDIQVDDPVQFDPQHHQGVQFLLFIQHGESAPGN